MHHQHNSRRKAYTLTELLVVVIVIGVLAAVSLPKFSKMLETRKTTEAEGIMRAIRTEQEKRCALDKNYFGNLSAMSDLVPNADTSHYTYTALAGGMSAQSKGNLNYQLQIPSYADGRICCEGLDCNKLNKDYPTCDELRAKPDYVTSPDDCAADVGESPDPGNCTTTPNPGMQTYDCCAQEGLRGRKTLEYYCDPNSGQWQPGAWQGKCEPNPDPEERQEIRECSEDENYGPGTVGTETRTCTYEYRCDNSIVRTGCTEWDDSTCNWETNFVWVVPVNHAPLSDVGAEISDCELDGTGAFNGVLWFHPTWVCNHCNKMPTDVECNLQNWNSRVYLWRCDTTYWTHAVRHCQYATCVTESEANRIVSSGWGRIVTDFNNPWGFDSPQLNSCD